MELIAVVCIAIAALVGFWFLFKFAVESIRQENAAMRDSFFVEARFSREIFVEHISKMEDRLALVRSGMDNRAGMVADTPNKNDVQKFEEEVKRMEAEELASMDESNDFYGKLAQFSCGIEEHEAHEIEGKDESETKIENNEEAA